MKSRHGSGAMADGLCAAGLTVRDIRAYLKDVHGLQVSPDLISRVTDAEPEEVREWQSGRWTACIRSSFVTLCGPGSATPTAAGSRAIR